jgi:hypothetical protein
VWGGVERPGVRVRVRVRGEGSEDNKKRPFIVKRAYIFELIGRQLGQMDGEARRASCVVRRSHISCSQPRLQIKQTNKLTRKAM